MNKHFVTHAAHGAKRRHQRLLRSATRIFCDTIEMNALQSVLGPAYLALHEARVLGLDAADLDALIATRGRGAIDDIINHVPMSIAA